MQVFDVAALLDHFTGDLVTQHESGWSRGSAANHVLIATANIGGYDLQDYAMVNFLAFGVLQLWIVD